MENVNSGSVPSKGEGLDLEAIEARLEAIKPGGFDDEWTASRYEENEPQAPDGWIVMGLDACLEASICQVFGGNQDPEAISKFIAAARTDIPALIAEIRRLRANSGDNGGSEASPLKPREWTLSNLMGYVDTYRAEGPILRDDEDILVREVFKGEPCEPTKALDPPPSARCQNPTRKAQAWSPRDGRWVCHYCGTPMPTPPAPTKEPKEG